MRLRRDKAAMLLLGVLTLGGLLAPLTHLVYMAVSDVYTPAPTHHGTAAHQADYAYWQAPHEGHIACPYVELFATPLVGDAAPCVSALAGVHRVASLQDGPQVSRRAALLFSYTVRGPPTVSSLL